MPERLLCWKGVCLDGRRCAATVRRQGAEKFRLSDFVSVHALPEISSVQGKSILLKNERWHAKRGRNGNRRKDTLGFKEQVRLTVPHEIYSVSEFRGLSGMFSGFNTVQIKVFIEQMIIQAPPTLSDMFEL